MDEKENFLGSAGGGQMQQRVPVFSNISPCKPLRSLIVPKKKLMYTKEFVVDVKEETAKRMHPPPQETENLNIATLDNVNTSSSSQAACQTHTPISDQEQEAFQKLMESNSTLEKKLHEKDEKLQALTSKCDHFQQMENLCSVLRTEVDLKNEQVEALEKTHVYLQQQADDSARKHSEELMSLVSALEASTGETRARERLVQVLARDLQKLKTNLERCKEELLRKDSKVKDLEEELKVMIRFLNKAQAERSSVDAANGTQNVKVLAPQASNGSIGNKYSGNLRQRNLRGEGRPWTCPESQLHSKRELQALVSKLKRKGEVWNVLEKSALISALEATEQQIPEKRAVDSDVNCRRDEERKKLKRVVTNSSTVRGSSPSYNHHHHHHRDDDGHNQQRHNCNDAADDHHHHHHHHQVQHHKFALCSVKALPSGKENHFDEDSRHHGHNLHHGHRGSNSIRSSALEEQLKQENHTLQARLKSLKQQLKLRLDELLAAQRERTEVAAKLAHVQDIARAMKGDMDRQVRELHVGLEEVSAERTTLRMVLDQRETSLSRLREGSVGGLMEKVELESSAATLQLKSNNLLHRAIQLRLGWHSCIDVAQLTL